MSKNNVPKYHELMNPLLQALHDLGGSGSNDEIRDSVIENMSLQDDVADALHDPEKSNQTEIEYRLGWARTYLKKYGLLENSSRGVWAIRPEKREIDQVDPPKVKRHVRELNRKKREARKEADENEDVPEGASGWRSELHRILTQEMEPDAFERLTKRLLRESGFIQVEVTGRSGDGGVDGKGIMTINGLLSFHVVFQCKRYQGSVSSGHVRDFRGAMVGRADKGLLITTGNFSRDAVKEATRPGAPPIDLVDGDELATKLRELELGVHTKVVEKVEVDDNWFRNI
jgi:restriction system protein